MKFAGKILALCVLQESLWGAAAFVPQPPRALSVTSSHTTGGLFSYLEGLDDGTQEPNQGVSSGSGNSPAPSFADESAKVQALESRLAALEKGPGGAVAPVGDQKIASPKKIWDMSSPVTVQGGSLKTWSFTSPSVERVQVVLNTEGRPLDADIELWQGPDNTPHKMRVYVENGSLRPFNAVVETPRGPNTIAIRNIGQLEFPLSAYVVADSAGPVADMEYANPAMTIQGGALRTFPFDSNVESVQVLLKTDGRPLNSRIELLQGPNNNKQVIELYTEDGLDRPFFVIIETPGSGNVVRVVNSATVEFPLTARVEPYLVGSDISETEAVLGGDSQGFMSPKVGQW